MLRYIQCLYSGYLHNTSSFFNFSYFPPLPLFKGLMNNLAVSRYICPSKVSFCILFLIVLSIRAFIPMWACAKEVVTEYKFFVFLFVDIYFCAWRLFIFAFRLKEESSNLTQAYSNQCILYKLTH